MIQIPIAAHEAWKRPWCSQSRVGPWTTKAAKGSWTRQWGDVSGVV